MVYVHPVTHANNNLVKINGDFIKPDLFANQICDGFRGCVQICDGK